MFAIQVSCSKMSWSRGQVTLPDSRRTFLERWQICHFRVAQKKIMHGWSDVDGVPCVLVLRQGCFQSERMWSLLWHNESFLFIYISPICSCRILISAVWRGFCLYLGLQKQLFIKQLYILYLTTGIHWFTGNSLSFLWSWFVSAFRQTKSYLWIMTLAVCPTSNTELPHNDSIIGGVNSPPYFSINSRTSLICPLTSKGLWMYFTV